MTTFLLQVSGDSIKDIVKKRHCLLSMQLYCAMCKIDFN